MTAEQSFSSNDSKSDCYSLSYRQVPDVTIEIRHQGTVESLYLFDPKYKLSTDSMVDAVPGEPLKQDVDKMHTYRDAIRRRDGKCVVFGAAILYPGDTIVFSPGLAAIRAYPGNSDTLKTAIREFLASAFQ